MITTHSNSFNAVTPTDTNTACHSWFNNLIARRLGCGDGCHSYRTTPLELNAINGRWAARLTSWRRDVSELSVGTGLDGHCRRQVFVKRTVWKSHSGDARDMRIHHSHRRATASSFYGQRNLPLPVWRHRDVITTEWRSESNTELFPFIEIAKLHKCYYGDNVLVKLEEYWEYGSEDKNFAVLRILHFINTKL